MWLRATGYRNIAAVRQLHRAVHRLRLGPQHWPIPQFLAVGTVNYVYKMLTAIALIPLLYLARAGNPQLPRAR